jgi:hypothetical protein
MVDVEGEEQAAGDELKCTSENSQQKRRRQSLFSLPQVALRALENKGEAVKKRVPLASCHFEKPNAKDWLRKYISRMPVNELELKGRSLLERAQPCSLTCTSFSSSHNL